MKTKLRRTLALSAVVPLMLAGVAACGDDSDDDKKDSNETSQTTDGGDEGTEGGDGTDEGTDGGDERPSGDITTDEFADLMIAGLEATTTAKVTSRTETNGVVSESEGVMDQSGDTMASHMTMSANGQDTEVIFVDGALYMSMPGTEGWTKMDMGSAAAGGMGEAMLDPAAVTKAFVDGLQSVEKVGDEDIDGVSTTHYRMVADMKAIMGALGGGNAAGAMDDVTQDVWLDSEGRTVRSTYEMEVSGVKVIAESTWSDFGAPVDIQAPPADQVTEMP